MRQSKKFSNNGKLLENSFSNDYANDCYKDVRSLFSKRVRSPITARFLKRSSESKWIVPPVKCVLSPRQSRGPRDSPASKFLLHSLPSPRASPTTSTLGTLVIFVKEAPSASLRPEGGERAAEHTCIYITRRNERKRERERLVFTWPSGLSTPPLLFRSSSGGSLQTEPPRPLAASFKPLSVLESSSRRKDSTVPRRSNEANFISR